MWEERGFLKATLRPETKHGAEFSGFRWNLRSALLYSKYPTMLRLHKPTQSFLALSVAAPHPSTGSRWYGHVAENGAVPAAALFCTTSCYAQVGNCMLFGT